MTDLLEYTGEALVALALVTAPFWAAYPVAILAAMVTP